MVRKMTTTEKPIETPKEGYEWVLRKDQKAGGYIEGLLEGGISLAVATEKAEMKYPSKWVQTKIGTSDREASIGMALNGLTKTATALLRLDLDPSSIIKRGVESLKIEGYSYRPNPLRDGGVQEYQGKPVMRWQYRNNASKLDTMNNILALAEDQQ